MNKLSKNLPSLQETINEIKSLCESGGKYEDAPHVIEILLPTICSYLNYWWSYGPSAKQQATDGLFSKTIKLDKGKKPDADLAKKGDGKTATMAALTYNEKADG